LRLKRRVEKGSEEKGVFARGRQSRAAGAGKEDSRKEGKKESDSTEERRKLSQLMDDLFLEVSWQPNAASKKREKGDTRRRPKGGDGEGASLQRAGAYAPPGKFGASRKKSRIVVERSGRKGSQKC